MSTTAELRSKLTLALATHRVGGQVARETEGPSVIRFDVTLSPGTKIREITAIQADIALALCVPTIRIDLNEGFVGIEVPKPKADEVTFARLGLQKPAELRAQGNALPLLLGVGLDGQTIAANLATMPHLLIAGTTGSGKSVCLHSAIYSLLAAHPSPKTLAMLMIDPKMVELSVYNDLPHLVNKVITSPVSAQKALEWMVMEMNRRCEVLARAGARNINEHNLSQIPGMYYIVIVIDELADLMMTNRKGVETPIIMLAQKARAVGMHLIIATQRPSVNVVTGLIKANFPTRIAFRVPSAIDSRTILDCGGAEKLLGNGDGLLLTQTTSTPQRFQGAYISPAEISSMIAKVAAERPADRSLEIADIGGRSEHFDQAAEIILATGFADAAILMKSLHIGYSTAAKLIHELQQAGIP